MKFTKVLTSALGIGSIISGGIFIQDRHVHAAGAAPLIGTYPDTANMAAMKAAADPIAIRAHAWAILSHFTNRGNSTNPEWEGGPGWEGKCGRVGLGNSDCPTSPGLKQLVLETPPQTLDLLSPPSTAPIHPFSVSSVLYNKDATDFIVSQRLATKGFWHSLNQLSYDNADKEITFPPGAVIVKEVWETVFPCTPHGVGSSGCPATVNVYDPQQVGNILAPPNIQFHHVGDWSNSMLPIDTDTHRECKANQTFSYYAKSATVQPNPPPKSEWTPINCFHWRLNTPTGNTTVWPGSGQFPATGPIPGTTSYLVLVGFHIITAELPGWTWSTFWWTRPDVNTLKRDDHPQELKNSMPWSLYSMDATLDETTPREANHAPKIAFNPYLEGTQPNGPVSNCITCHARAVYRDPLEVHNQPQPYLMNDMAHLLRPQCLLMNMPGSNCPANGYLTDKQYFVTNKGVRTHFLWSLAIKQDPDALSRFDNTMSRPIQ